MLTRFDPFRELDRLAAALSSPVTGRWLMPMDAYQRDDQLVLAFDLPGVSAEAVRVTVEDADLVVHAERRYAPDPDDQVLLAERPWGEAVRRVTLGDRYDLSELRATMAAGELRVVVPVLAPQEPRQVQIESPAIESTAELDSPAESPAVT